MNWGGLKLHNDLIRYYFFAYVLFLALSWLTPDFEPLALSMARRSKGLALIGFGGIARSLLNLHGLLAFIFEPWRHGPSRKKVLPIKTLGRCLTQTDDLND